MKYWILGALGILALTLIIVALIPETEIPTNYVVLPEPIPDTCDRTKELGGGCYDSCECLKPLECRQGRCAIQRQKPAYDCVSHDDCTTNYCSAGKCTYPPEFTGKRCRVVCRQEINQERECYTACSEIGYDTTQYNSLT